MLSRTDLAMRLRRNFFIFNGDTAQVISNNPNNGLSNYNAFTAKMERRFQNGFGWTVAYTFSKWISNVAATSVTGMGVWGNYAWPQFFYNRSLERSLDFNQIPHRLVASPIVDLPFGKGRKWLNQGGVLNAVLGGWQLSSIGTLQSGSPVAVIVLNGSANLLGDGTNQVVLRPNLVGDPNSPNQGQPAVGIRGLQWVTPAAFANPPRYTYGNASRTLPGVLKPGLVNFDAMLAKNFRIAERFRAQFRWEAFNLTNTPAWGPPSNAFGSSNFGVVTAGGRRIMQLGLKIYW
jgi:hypothetical protein